MTSFAMMEQKMAEAKLEKQLEQMPGPIWQKLLADRRAARKAEQLSRFAERLAAWRPGSTRSVGGFIP